MAWKSRFRGLQPAFVSFTFCTVFPKSNKAEDIVSTFTEIEIQTPKFSSHSATHRCKIFSKSPRLCDFHYSVSINRYKSEYEVYRKHDRFEQFENV